MNFQTFIRTFASKKKMDIFEISNIFVEIFGYKLSFLEFAAVLTGLAAVYLASLGKVVNFYIGLINNVLYFLLFYQCHLYSMMILQAVYFVISSYGIYAWTKQGENQQLIKITELSNNQRIKLSVVVVLVSIVWGFCVVKLSGQFPEYIEKPAYPMIDALLTIASIAGQILLTRKKIDNWLIWIFVNMASVILYAAIGIYFTAILYVLFLLIAIKAFAEWKRELLKS
ncbi:MAG: nicotinamide riboside transporter PnuC [Prevotellaceae bacterium]|jgi:nicotinamide mononucleotide transporter|nr:nicotinamide riboside transporter PnuC [Prevotellaceae bacterium]